MTIDLCWQSFWEWLKDYQTVFVFSIGAIVWFAKSLVAHRLIPWLRCKFKLHKYEDWDLEEFLGNLEEFKNQGSPMHGKRVKTFNATRYCIDCGREDPMVIQERIKRPLYSSKLVVQRRYGHQREPDSAVDKD